MSGVFGRPLVLQPEDIASEYEPAQLRAVVESIRTLQVNGYSRFQDVLIAGEPDSAGRRPHLVLRSPDGNLWRVEVDNAGALSTTNITIDTVSP